VSNCIVDPRKLLSFDFGEYHPFKTYRLGLAYDLYHLTLENIILLRRIG